MGSVPDIKAQHGALSNKKLPKLNGGPITLVGQPRTLDKKKNAYYYYPIMTVVDDIRLSNTPIVQAIADCAAIYFSNCQQAKESGRYS